MTITDMEIIKHLDFEYQPPCESQRVSVNDAEDNCNGENPAEWKVVRSCCGKMSLYCSDCLRRKIYDCTYLICVNCKSEFLASQGSLWRAYSIVERL